MKELESQYQARNRQERPTRRLAQAHQRLQAADKRLQSRHKAWQEAQSRLDKTAARWEGQQAELKLLKERLARFEQDNATNPEAVAAEFRPDAGFGSYENLALLSEMGYEVYTKPHSYQVVAYLRQQVDDQTAWVRLGITPKWSPGVTCRSKAALTLWMSPWSASTPPQPASTAPASTSEKSR